MRRETILSLAVFALLLAGRAVAEGESEKPIADGDLGLAKGSVFDVLTPPVQAVNTTDPGDRPSVVRAYADAPPRIPHAVADFMPIRRQENWCADCHMTDWRAPEEGEPTPIPSSHYIDLRSGSDEIGESIVGARWVCVSCHVPVTDAPPLVANSFDE